MANGIRIVDDEEAASADFMVCMPASTPAVFPDDVFDFCCRCDAKVRHRPDAPRSLKKICMPCALPEMEAEHARDELEIVTTPSQLASLAPFLRRKQ